MDMDLKQLIIKIRLGREEGREEGRNWKRSAKTFVNW